MNDKSEIADYRREFEQKYLEHYNSLFAYLLRKLGNRADAEDITHTTFQRFLAHMEKVQWRTEVKNVNNYLRKAALNLCVDLWKRKIDETQVSYDDEEDEKTQHDLQEQAVQRDDPYTSIENRIFYKEVYKSLPLNAILGRLSKYELDLLYLHVVDEGTAEEIAKIVDKDVHQVRYDLNKLLAKIRYRVNKLFPSQLTINREEIRTRFRNKLERVAPVNTYKRIKPINTVRPKHEAEHESWLSLSGKRLGDAYGQAEEEYSLDSIIEANPEYEGR